MLASSKPAHLLTLAEAVELIVYAANCDRCHETRRVDLATLRDQLGPHVVVNDIRERLRCAKCGSRRVIIVILWKRATSTESLTANWK